MPLSHVQCILVLGQASWPLLILKLLESGQINHRLTLTIELVHKLHLLVLLVAGWPIHKGHLPRHRCESLRVLSRG